MNERARGNAVEPLLHETAAAEILGVSPRTLADWRRRGIGPRYTRVGRRLVRYTERELARFLAEGACPVRVGGDDAA